MPEPKRVLLLATNTAGHEAFAAAAGKLGLELISGTEDCEGGLTLDFNTRDSALRIVQYAMDRPLAAIVVGDERPLPVAARAASMLGLPFHPPKTGDALRDRKRLDVGLHAAGLELAEVGKTAIEVAGVMTESKLRVLGIFDQQRVIANLDAEARERLPDLLRSIIKSLSLTSGPVYVAATANLSAVTNVSAVVPRDLASALRFRIPLVDEDISWQELLIRHALGMDISRAYRK
jgi:hypothetical protein